VTPEEAFCIATSWSTDNSLRMYFISASRDCTLRWSALTSASPNGWVCVLPVCVRENHKGGAVPRKMTAITRMVLYPEAIGVQRQHR